MTKRRSRRPGVPAYLLHKASGQAITVLRTPDGKRKQLYLGTYDSPESHRKYREVLASYLDPACDPINESPNGSRPITIGDLVAWFLAWAERYYVNADGNPSREHPNFVAASSFLLQLYRDELADDFGPLKLKRVREAMIDHGWGRVNINKQIGRINRIFKWGAEEELVSAEVFNKLRVVAGLKKGRTTAHEPRRIEPVAWKHVKKVLPLVSKQVKAMILLQWFTGMRPGEVVQMRTCDIDVSGKVWIYRPHDHKTAYRDREREVCIGPEAQKILKTFLSADRNAYLFRASDAVKDQRAAKREARETPLWPSHVAAQKRKRKARPNWKPGEHYSTNSYRRAIHRACEIVNKGLLREHVESGGNPKDAPRIEVWSPNQLRHSRATEVRKRFGLEAAQVTLGHAQADITQVYAERDRELAIRVALETG